MESASQPISCSSRGSQCGPCRAFTLVEMLITLLLIGIVTAMVLPMLGPNERTHAFAAVELFLSDLDFAQTTAINQPSEAALMQFDASIGRWWVAPESDPDEPYLRSPGDQPCDVTLGEGRAEHILGVSFTLNGITNNRIAYEAFGRLMQLDNAEITFTRGNVSMQIVIDSETGFAAVQ